MKVVGYFPHIHIQSKDILLIRNSFVKHGFDYIGTARFMPELKQLIQQGGVTVLASGNFNEIGTMHHRLQLMMMLSKYGIQYFDIEVNDIQNILHLRERV